MSLNDAAQFATIIGVVLVTPQIGIALWSIVVTNRRDRIKSTLDYYEEFNAKIKIPKKELKEKYGEIITREVAEKIDNDKKDAEKLRNILNQYERLSLGVNLNIYDLKTIKRICGRRLIENYNRYKEYMYYRRDVKKIQIMYEEFETLVIQLQQIKLK
jgi:hypothetical protein